MSKAKAAESGGSSEQAPKSKKKLIIIIAAVVLLLVGGGAAFVLLKPSHQKFDQAGEEAAAHEEEQHDEQPPVFVDLGSYTANLIQEEGDRYLQVTISVKVDKPELEEKLKARIPEISHRINMLLQSKRPSELYRMEGKTKLAEDIKAHIEYVMGFRKSAPEIRATPIEEEGDAAQSAPETSHSTHEAAPEEHVKKGISEVLFTTFIIQ